MGTSSHQFGFKFSGAELTKFGANTTSVIGRFFPSCPPDIIGFVVAIIVDTIQHSSDKRFANISKKVGKISPAFTNFNATTSIIFKLFKVWVAAASVHVGPRPIKGMAFITSGVPMTMRFFTAAPTRLGVAIFNASSFGYMSLSAVASAFPQKFAVRRFIASWSNCDQSIKAHSCDIKCVGHRTGSFGSGSSGEAGVRSTGLTAHYAMAKG